MVDKVDGVTACVLCGDSLVSAALETLLREALSRLDVIERQNALVLAAVRPEQLTPAERAVVESLYAVFGTQGVLSREIAAMAASPIGDRPALRAALLQVVDHIDPHRIGLTLQDMVYRGGCANSLRLTSPTKERGSRLWCVERG